MNGFGGYTRKPVYSPAQDPDLQVGSPRYAAASDVMQAPSSKVLLESYNNSMVMQNEERPRYNPLNAMRPRSSALLNVNDPMAMHLLVETAMVDGQEYEVLSFEEVDELKKEYSLLSNRIEASKRKLALESKVRDAAVSLSRLYSKKGGKSEGSESGAHRHRRSFLGSRGSGSELVNKTDEELVASNRKCEELAQELFRLNNRATDIQKRLLQHTAGILQMTHRGNTNKHTVGMNMRHQIPPPGSPESMYAYSNGRALSPPLEDSNEFDDRSLYRTPDKLDDIGSGYDGINDSATGISKYSGRTGSQNSASGPQTEFIIQTEKKLEDLNNRLRGLIVQANPQNESYDRPPQYQTNGVAPQPGASLEAQLDYLEQGLSAMSQQGSTIRDLQDQEYSTEQRLEELNIQLCNMITNSQSQHTSAYQPPPPPKPSGGNIQRQLIYLEDALVTVERQLQGFLQNTKSVNHQEKVEQYDTVLTGLWEIILSSEDEVRQRKLKKRQERAEDPDAEEEDFSPDEDFSPNEEFSLQAFSAKVQWLYARATSLREQKSILRRQVKQQRELNNKSDASKDSEIMEARKRLAQLTEELNHTKKVYREADIEASNAREELTVVMERLDSARRESILREQQRGNDESTTLKAEREARREAEESMMSELRDKQAEIARLQEELEEANDDLGIARAELNSEAEEMEAKIKSLEEQLVAAMQAKTDAETKEASLLKQIEEKSKLADQAETEMRRVEGELVRLQTELTISRAELDGAYGTRAQRAAEVAANPAIQKELDDMAKRNASLLEEINALRSQKEAAGGGDLRQRVGMLQKELSETIAEYETMTKHSIEAEKEQEQLEQLIDSLRDRIESLEAQLSDEKVRWLGMKSPGPGSAQAAGGESTSTMVLKNEFKKMMRDTRAENMKLLRAEQEERRKLETIIRDLKKQQVLAKSSLSQSTTT